MDWLKNITIEELPENYQEMVRLLVEGDSAMKIHASLPDRAAAFSVIMALATYYNKQPFYFSGLDAIISRRKREYVIKNRGMRVADLARATGWSQQAIYDVFESLQKSRQNDLFSPSCE
jgi:Mor family transcriptional regulator